MKSLSPLTCSISPESELFGDFSPAEGILGLNLDLRLLSEDWEDRDCMTDLIVDLYLQLVESEGCLVVIFVLDSVLRPRYDHTGPGVAVAAVIQLKYFLSIFLLTKHKVAFLLEIFCTAGDTALYWHSCPSSRIS